MMMNHGDDKKDIPVPSSSNSHTPIFLKDNAVAIYTFLAVLVRLKNTVGLEAMLEYIDHYQKLIEKHNPAFKGAVQQALELMSVEKMYRDIQK